MGRLGVAAARRLACSRMRFNRTGLVPAVSEWTSGNLLGDEPQSVRGAD